ncbi:MAG TPA: phage holin family protein [Chthoniobacteraceae bacterium]|jgi:putative membrane protein
MRSFLIRWLITTLAVAAAVQLTGMQSEGLAPVFCVALFLGIINALLRPMLLMLSLPFILLTLGFFILVVNALMLSLAGALVPGFRVGGFGNAFFGALIVSLVSGILSGLTREKQSRAQVTIRPAGMKQVEGRVVEQPELHS